MRSPEQVKQITDGFSEPQLIEDFLSATDINYLVDMFDQHPDKIHKNTGPITVNLSSTMLDDPVFTSIFRKLEDVIGEFRFLSGFFFYVEAPHIIHNDDSFEFPCIFKGVTLPLRYDRDTMSVEYPNLFFFDQFYLNGPAKFFNGGSNAKQFYNKLVYEYSEVQNKSDVSFDESVRLKYIPHIRPQWLDGLSFDRALPQKPGNVLIFDAVRLHCATDFTKLGIKSKLGLSIFTQK